MWLFRVKKLLSGLLLGLLWGRRRMSPFSHFRVTLIPRGFGGFRGGGAPSSQHQGLWKPVLSEPLICGHEKGICSDLFREQIKTNRGNPLRILPGWYGMENGQKSEMEKNGDQNAKRPQAGQGGQKWQKIKMAQKWKKNNGKLPQKSIFGLFFGHFCPFPAWGRFPFRFPSFFFPFPAFLAWPPLQSLAVKKNFFFVCKFRAVKSF